MAAKIKSYAKSTGHRHHKPRGISDHAFKKVYWPYIPVILVIAALLSFGTQTGALSSVIKHPDGKVLSYATSMSIGGLLSDTNTKRVQNGVAGLHLNSKLDAAAQAKANDMASRNYWSHNTPEGNPPWIFVTAQKYSYQKLGENLAAGFGDEQSTINGWMASPPHKENLLDPAFSDVGFGFANNPNYTSAGGGPMTIVVAFYGKPQAAVAQTSTPASTSTPPSHHASTPAVAASSASAAATAKSQKDASKPSQSKPKPATKASETKPATTQTAIKSEELTAKSSRAQILLASFPLAKFGSSLAAVGALAAIVFWLSRHMLAARRAFVYGESFAIRHPLMDVGLLVIAALSFLLTQTAGLIQ